MKYLQPINKTLDPQPKPVPISQPQKDRRLGELLVMQNVVGDRIHYHCEFSKLTTISLHFNH